MNKSETGSIATLRTLLAERRMVAQRRHRLRDELSSFRTPAERAELDAILSRASADDVAELAALVGGTPWNTISR